MYVDRMSLILLMLVFTLYTAEMAFSTMVTVDGVVEIGQYHLFPLLRAVQKPPSIHEHMALVVRGKGDNQHSGSFLPQLFPATREPSCGRHDATTCF